MNLPKELQDIILGYIDPKDKIYASLTCTLFKNILETQFNTKYKDANHVPTNCAYDLNLYLHKFKIPSSKFLTSRKYYLPGSTLIDNNIDNLNVLVCFLQENNRYRSNIDIHN